MIKFQSENEWEKRKVESIFEKTNGSEEPHGSELNHECDHRENEVLRSVVQMNG